MTADNVERVAMAISRECFEKTEGGWQPSISQAMDMAEKLIAAMQPTPAECARDDKIFSGPMIDRLLDDVARCKEAVSEATETAVDFYTARNGKKVTLEDHNGEKMWLITDDALNALRAIEGASHGSS